MRKRIDRKKLNFALPSKIIEKEGIPLEKGEKALFNYVYHRQGFKPIREQLIFSDYIKGKPPGQISVKYGINRTQLGKILYGKGSMRGRQQKSESSLAMHRAWAARPPREKEKILKLLYRTSIAKKRMTLEERKALMKEASVGYEKWLEKEGRRFISDSKQSWFRNLPIKKQNHLRQIYVTMARLSTTSKKMASEYGKQAMEEFWASLSVEQRKYKK